MTVIGLPTYYSKYGAESFQERNEGILTPVNKNGKDTFNKEYKKKQDPTNGLLLGITTLIGGLVIFKNKKAIPGLIKSVKTTAKKFYSKLTLPSLATVKTKAKQAGKFIMNLFTKKP